MHAALTERDASARVELWVRLLTALASASAGSAAAVGAAAAAAVADTRHVPAAYPQLLYVYGEPAVAPLAPRGRPAALPRALTPRPAPAGAFLRSAGLSEQLVQLTELAAAMNFPPAGFPPPRDLAAERRAEAQLRDYEDATIASGLPLGEVWARVERARGALHWRAPAAAEDLAADLAADPQRAPSAHDAADLLLPVVCPRAALLLLAALLRLAEVPLLPAAEFAVRAAGPPAAAAAGWEAAGGAALLALLRAARRLPRDHPARPTAAAARRLLALAPQRPPGAPDTTGEPRRPPGPGLRRPLTAPVRRVRGVGDGAVGGVRRVGGPGAPPGAALLAAALAARAPAAAGPRGGGGARGGAAAARRGSRRAASSRGRRAAGLRRVRAAGGGGGGPRARPARRAGRAARRNRGRRRTAVPRPLHRAVSPTILTRFVAPILYRLTC